MTPSPIPAHLFATPFEGDYPSLARFLTEQGFLMLVRISDHLADRLHQDRLPIQSTGDVPEPPPSSGWRPEIGSAALGVSRHVDKEGWSWLSGQLLLASFMEDRLSALAGTFHGPYPLTVAGHTLFGGPYRVEAQGTALEIRNLSTHLTLHFQRTDGGKGVSPWVADGQVPLRVGSEAFAVQTTDAWMDFWFPDAERGEVTMDPEIPARFEEGMSLIEECSPHYYQWIALPLREVVPIGLCLKGTHSQSFAAWPGQVHIPVTTPLNLLVSLVHECSHQYYHMLQWHTRLVRPSAPEVYSALKKVNRPLEKLLKGFHAFGNVMLALQGVEAMQDRFNPASSSSAPDPAMDRELQVIYRSSYPEVVKANLKLIAGLDKELQAQHQLHFEEPGTALYLALRTRLLNAGLLPSGGAEL